MAIHPPVSGHHTKLQTWLVHGGDIKKKGLILLET